MPGAVQLDDDTLNFDGSGFSRRESAGDFLTGGGIDRSVLLEGEEDEDQEEEGGDGEEVSVPVLSSCVRLGVFVIADVRERRTRARDPEHQWCPYVCVFRLRSFFPFS